MDLMTLLPSFYDGNITMKKLQDILSADVNSFESGLNTAVDQCFVNSANALLSRYENILGIEVDLGKSDEFRREQIKAKIRGTGTVTKQMLKETAKAYSNGEVEVIEDSQNYKFIIKFVCRYGIPANMEGLRATINKIKPAHLSYELEFIGITWGERKNLTWNDINIISWQSVKFGTYNVIPQAGSYFCTFMGDRFKTADEIYFGTEV